MIKALITETPPRQSSYVPRRRVRVDDTGKRTSFIACHRDFPHCSPAPVVEGDWTKRIPWKLCTMVRQIFRETDSHSDNLVNSCLRRLLRAEFATGQEPSFYHWRKSYWLCLGFRGKHAPNGQETPRWNRKRAEKADVKSKHLRT